MADDFQGELAARSQAGNEMVLNLIRSLGSAVVYDDSNVETNRKLWDLYARHWAPEEDFVRRMAGNLEREGAGEPGEAPPPPPELVGDEWSRPQDVDRVLEEFVFPYLAPETRALEIGSGGGRIARRVAERGVGSLLCVDISSGMLERARAALAGHDNVTFELLPEARLPAALVQAGELDFVYCFDVFVHVDLHTMWGYFQDIARALKPGGRAFVSTANLLAPLGWERFAVQSKFTVGGFYFVTPDAVNALVARAGLEVERTGADCAAAIEAGNVYFLRDYLLLLRKPPPSAAAHPQRG